ncbi:MAG: c-type cytochrome [Verrucomicrobiae bacterium]|nr:c-type cytochrome [Verrucomicrobiae bacterium]
MNFLKSCLLLLMAWNVLGQSGDRAGEAQADVVPPDRIPAAPVLDPWAAQQAFRLPPGFGVELVAAEPLVRSPVAMQFDLRGRLWVVEMTGYMNDAEGSTESEPSGSVVILEDVDGDGRMDRRTVFLDGLVMPRALMLTGDGVVVAEPPRLWFVRDTDGDGRADERVEIASDYATQNDPALGDKSNPEHASNGLLWARDNWVYSANHTGRMRWNGSPTNWIFGPTQFRGQWGLTQDDRGRLYFNSNSDQIRAELVPDAYFARNRNLRSPFGANVPLSKDQRVWTSRVNPGVNRGYQAGQLTPEGHLASFTGACGPVVYRGDQFGPEFPGDVFLCEPTGNFIRRNRIFNHHGLLTATNAYDASEFLSSSDERFRPVNLYNGPDGALYVLDLHRGLIQHRIYLTSYLRRQLESRDLMTPVDHGRIWRIVNTNRPPGRVRPLSDPPTTAELVGRITDPNGFWRDAVQQRLVERADPAATPLLRELIRTNVTSAPGRLAALWTLEGLGALDLPTIEVALGDGDGMVRSAALRLTERFLDGPERETALNLIYRRAGFIPAEEQLQLMLTLGAVGTPTADAILRALLMNTAPDALRVHAALSGIGGRELEFLAALLADPNCSTVKDGHVALLSGLARCITHEADPVRVARLLALTSGCGAGDWQQRALLDGMVATLPAPPRPGHPPPLITPIVFEAEPPGLSRLRTVDDPDVHNRLARLDVLLVWPEKPGYEAPVAVASLEGAEQESFERGRELYPVVCGACHQPHGLGQEGLAPPLASSEWTTGSEQRLIRIALHGVRDAMTVNGTVWNLAMPAFVGALEDAQIADLLTYIRRAWGHAASPVSVGAVTAVREAHAEREDAWTEAELLAVP